MKQVDFLTEQQAKKLVEVCKKDKQKLITLIMLDCGLRVSECASLKLSNFDFKNRLLVVKSLKKRQEEEYRQIPISARLYECLANYLTKYNYSNKDAFLFPSSSKEGHITRRAIHKQVSAKKEKLNIERLYPHKLRHSFATITYANGAKIEEVKELLGHKSFDTTLIYAKIPQNRLEQAIKRNHKTSLFLKIKKYFFPANYNLININYAENITVGRVEELATLQDNISKGINTLVLGPVGIGKSHLLKLIKTDKKILIFDHFNELKETFLHALLYIYKNDKEEVVKLLYSDFDEKEIKKKIQRNSTHYIVDELMKLTDKKEYTIVIDSLDNLTNKGVQILEKIKDHFTIIAAARQISITKNSAFWNFETIRLKSITNKDSAILITRLTYEMNLSPTLSDRLTQHIQQQSNNNPRAIIELIERYKKEPIITTDTIADIKHLGARGEIDLTWVILLAIGITAGLRFLAREADNSAFRMIGGIALILLILSRQFFKVSKPKNI